MLSINVNGAWPSGKATGFGPVIRRFESFRPRAYPSTYPKQYNNIIYLTHMNHRIFDIYILYQNKGYFFEAIKLKKKKKKN